MRRMKPMSSARTRVRMILILRFIESAQNNMRPSGFVPLSYDLRRRETFSNGRGIDDIEPKSRWRIPVAFDMDQRVEWRANDRQKLAYGAPQDCTSATGRVAQNELVTPRRKFARRAALETANREQ